MMMGRRIRLRGPIRPLSPTEGKFGLKSGARSGGGWRYFCTGMRLKAMKPGLFASPEVFEQAPNFSLGKIYLEIDLEIDLEIYLEIHLAERL
ncbi:hypothetical protein [Bradyrhizobium sp.]|uniref:hypothetical protein n=1 Tax=Bradyrhizobium sp. TaxID=376 RepID=UPI002736D25D|nr:hypothetical protein [Bradyrhizobium sp.]MDP3074585.1 hypothetical protein [Bradyrhizobium sp.]